MEVELIQYGLLALWTVSLLWMNYKREKERKVFEEKAREQVRIHQQDIVEKLKQNEYNLKIALEKLDSGISEVRNRTRCKFIDRHNRGRNESTDS